MASERMYSQNEVREILELYRDYNRWGGDIPTNSRTEYETAKSLLERCRKYPEFFEREPDILEKTSRRFVGLSSW